MITARKLSNRAWSPLWAFGVIAIAGLLLLAPARGVAAASVAAPSLEQCIENEWADYNVCLSTSSWWRKYLCDWWFQIALGLCYDKYREVKTPAA